MVDVANLCMGCMELKGPEPVCPQCGYREGTTPDSPLHLRARTELHGQYLVGKVLGHGGFGITYLGWDLNLERKIAIKEYLPSGVAVRTGVSCDVVPFSGETRKDFEYGLERYLDEARTVARFQTHPSVVSVLNFFRANGTAYLVMEYLEGATFERFLESNGGKTSMDMVMTVMVPVLEALGSVHSQGILHRDISPDNIYITRKWQVKVLDFGAARYALGQKSRNLSVILKEGYAPVEQYHSKGNQGPWTDVYACGATIYRALTGKIPPASLDRLQADDMAAPSTQGVELSASQERTLLRALSVQPDQRFRTMQEFKDELTGVAVASAPVVGETGEKIPVANAGSQTPAVPVVTGPKQSSTVGSGTPEPKSQQDWNRPAPHSKHGQSASLPKWVWAAAAGMLLALSAIGGYNYYQNKQREIAAQKQQEIARQQREEETKRQERERKELEAREELQRQQDAILKKQQEELDLKLKEIENQQKQLEAARKSNRPPQQNNQQSAIQRANAEAAERLRLEQERQEQLRRQEELRRQQADINRRRNAVPTPAPTLVPTPVPPVTQITQNYDDLIRNAANYTKARNYNAAVQLNQQAMKLNPARPDAYANIGWIALYGTGDMQTALANYREAINRGGTAWFRVLHDHDKMNYQLRCEGDLGIAKSGVTFNSQDGADNFTFNKDAIREIKANRNPFRIIKGDFHIEGTDRRNFNLLPVNNASQVRDMIMQLAK